MTKEELELRVSELEKDLEIANQTIRRLTDLLSTVESSVRASRHSGLLPLVDDSIVRSPFSQ